MRVCGCADARTGPMTLVMTSATLERKLPFCSDGSDNMPKLHSEAMLLLVTARAVIRTQYTALFVSGSVAGSARKRIRFFLSFTLISCCGQSRVISGGKSGDTGQHGRWLGGRWNGWSGIYLCSLRVGACEGMGRASPFRMTVEPVRAYRVEQQDLQAVWLEILLKFGQNCRVGAVYDTILSFLKWHAEQVSRPPDNELVAHVQLGPSGFLGFLGRFRSFGSRVTDNVCLPSLLIRVSVDSRSDVLGE